MQASYSKGDYAKATDISDVLTVFVASNNIEKYVKEKCLLSYMSPKNWETSSKNRFRCNLKAWSLNHSSTGRKAVFLQFCRWRLVFRLFSG